MKWEKLTIEILRDLWIKKEKFLVFPRNKIDSFNFEKKKFAPDFGINFMTYCEEEECEIFFTYIEESIYTLDQALNSYSHYCLIKFPDTEEKDN
jgi:hypothetical protein